MKDPCIRRLLRETELSHYINDNDSKVVNELSLPVAGARIDMAVINGSLHGYEIKSASDTLQRLPAQIEAYSKVFDYLSIVTEGKYHIKLKKTIPSWVGLILCDDSNGVKTVKQVRKPKRNKNVKGFYIAKLLWKEELMECLSEHQIPFKKKDRTWILCEILESNLDIETLSLSVRNKLKSRIDWKEQ